MIFNLSGGGGGSSGYKATIYKETTSTAPDVIYSGTTYKDDGDVFYFSAGDTITIRIMGSTTYYKFIYIDGISEASASGTQNCIYDYTAPSCDINIYLTRGTNISDPQTEVYSLESPSMKSYIQNTDITHFPSGITQVADYAMTKRTLRRVNLPNTVTTIGDYAFQDSYFSDAFTSFPSSLTSIGNSAFYTSSSSVTWNTTLPNSITSLGPYCFYGRGGLNFPSLPSNLTIIPNYCFYNCSSLSLTSLPSNLTTVNTYAFYGCTSLALTSLPNTLTSIGTYAFQNCRALALTSLPSLTTINSGVFSGCNNLSLSTLPSSITSINTNAFQYCSSLIDIECLGAITTLGNSAFLGSTTYTMNLKTAKFPNATCSSIGTVFGSTSSGTSCRYLELVDLGSTQSIAANAFNGCLKLQTVILRKTDSICTLANISAFTNTPLRGYNSLTGTVYVPAALISSYQTASNWSTLYSNGTVTFSAIEGSQYEL